MTSYVVRAFIAKNFAIFLNFFGFVEQMYDCAVSVVLCSVLKLQGKIKIAWIY